MNPHDRLSAYINAAKITSAEMARRCEYDRGNFHRVLKGEVRPSLTLAARIERETGGAIPAAAWADEAKAA